MIIRAQKDGSCSITKGFFVEGLLCDEDCSQLRAPTKLNVCTTDEDANIMLTSSCALMVRGEALWVSYFKTPLENKSIIKDCQGYLRTRQSECSFTLLFTLPFVLEHGV